MKKFLKKINRKTIIFALLVFSLLIAFIAIQDKWSFRKDAGVASKLARKCEKITDKANLTRCRLDVLHEAIDNWGIDTGFEVLSLFFEDNPVFASECHDFAHILGEEAYEKFSRQEDFGVSTKTSYCAYGFYHGFMEQLVSRNGDIEQAREFCAYVDERLKDKSPGAYLACYHGIGHGWTDGQEELHWGDELGIAKPALELCEKVAETDHELLICATGVFDSIAIGYYNQAYGLEMNEEDPFWICKEQPEKYKEACYMDIIPAIIWLGDYSFVKSLPYIETAEVEYRTLATGILAENAVRYILKNGEEPLDYVKVCRQFEEDRALECVKGLATGVMQFGDPEEEYKLALNFCKSGTLNTKEKDICFENVLKYSQSLYSSEKVEEICDGVNEKYKEFCFLE